jgi:selenocysteine lyase/cysteine desulfurase
VHRLKQEGICDYNIAAFDYDIDTCVQISNPSFSLIRYDRLHAASNVFGCVLPISKIGALASENGIRFIADAAQTAGVLPINSMSDNIDILCCAGHKSLMGLMGTGFIAVADGVILNSFMFGGTGSSSLSADMPDYLPDMLEAGTLNNIGIASLGAGVDYINSRGRIISITHENGALPALVYIAVS